LQDRLRRTLRPLLSRRAAAARKPGHAGTRGHRLDRQLRGGRPSHDRSHLARTPGDRLRQPRARRRGSPAAVPGSRRPRNPFRHERERMTAHQSVTRAPSSEVFSTLSRAMFAASYPEGAHKLRHELGAHPLLELESLAALGEALPEKSIEYNRGDLPIGVDGKPGSTGLTIGETIRGIRQTNSWAVLKNVEQDPAYAALLADLLSELEPEIVAKTGRMLMTQAFIFVSSPNAVTPYHFDPEHNIL